MDPAHGVRAALTRRPRRGRTFGALVVAAVLAAACGSYDRNPPDAKATTTSRRTTTTASTRPGETTTSTAPGATTSTTRPATTVPPTTGPVPTIPPASLGNRQSLPTLPGRLAVIDRLGRLVTLPVSATSTSTVPVSDASNGTISLPVWSYDSTRLAWVTTSPVGAAIESAAVGSSDRARATINSSPVYLEWTADRAGANGAARATPAFTYLRAATDTQVLLGAITLATGATERALGQNPSIFYGVSPDGTQALVHSGRDDLIVVNLTTGASRTLTTKAGSFRTPVWLDNQTVLVAVRGSDTATQHVLTKLNVVTEARQDLLRFQGVIDYVVDPLGLRAAYQITGGGGGATSPAVFEQQTPTTTLPLASIGRLSVLELRTGRNNFILDTTALAFTWSPTADRLAFLAPRGENQVQWRFWSEGTIASSATFAPVAWVRQYIDAFSQYDHSVRFFSPDGRAFVFAGRTGEQESVFVQPLDRFVDPLRPVLLIDGSYATWSPS